MDTILKSIGIVVLWVPLMFIVGLALAWVPMLGWNNSFGEMFPQLPKMTYWQAFWFTQFAGYIFIRPRA